MSKYQHDSLGTRMKTYEATAQQHLQRRTPVIIRIDGKAFHTYTKRLKFIDPSMKQDNVPFSIMMKDAMVETTKALVNEIQGCVLGYTQSDEISLLLRDWDDLETQSWFASNIQKMASVSASIATAAFNFTFASYQQPQKLSDMARFDSRVYNLPKEEVVNYFVWRQNDASRNSVQMLGHHHFSQKQMHAKSNSQVQDMLMLEKSVNWNDLPTWMKRGTCVVRTEQGLVIDEEIPIFTKDRTYIHTHLKTPTERAAEQADKEALQDLLLTI